MKKSHSIDPPIKSNSLSLLNITKTALELTFTMSYVQPHNSTCEQKGPLLEGRLERKKKKIVRQVA